MSAWLQVAHNKHGVRLCYVSEWDNLMRQRRVRIPEWQTLRTWPGPGSRAMGWCVHRSVASSIVKKVRVGRACGILLEVPTPQRRGQSERLLCVGVHAAHGDLLAETLADVARLVGSHRGARICAAGDRNVDQLPALQEDPWAA